MKSQNRISYVLDLMDAHNRRENRILGCPRDPGKMAKCLPDLSGHFEALGPYQELCARTPDTGQNWGWLTSSSGERQGEHIGISKANLRS